MENGRGTEDAKPGEGFLYGEVILVAKEHLSPREMQISRQELEGLVSGQRVTRHIIEFLSCKSRVGACIK